jgi:hypothetical protein
MDSMEKRYERRALASGSMRHGTQPEESDADE